MSWYLGYIVSRLEEAAQNYETQFHKLIKILQDQVAMFYAILSYLRIANSVPFLWQGEKAGDFARYLSFHLDLNIFGHSVEHGGMGQGSLGSRKVDHSETSGTERAIRAEDIDAARPLASSKRKSRTTPMDPLKTFE